MQTSSGGRHNTIIAAQWAERKKNKKYTPLLLRAENFRWKNWHIIRRHHFVIARDANSDTVCAHPSSPCSILYSLRPTRHTNKIVIVFPVANFSHASRRETGAFVLPNNYFCLTITFLPLTRIENVYLWLHSSYTSNHFGPHFFLVFPGSICHCCCCRRRRGCCFHLFGSRAKDEPFAIPFIYCHLSAVHRQGKILYESFALTQ